VLADKEPYATIPVTDIARAKRFYGETLGFEVERDTEGGVMYRAGSGRFFVYPSRFRAAGHTQLSWLVGDIKAEVRGLKARGVDFEQYDNIPGLTMVDSVVQSGPEVWTAWFKDPDGNLLGLTQLGS
jgi:catechol 2,3-dioxygenase-like lactoylglutathione lyase family enzyme